MKREAETENEPGSPTDSIPKSLRGGGAGGVSVPFFCGTIEVLSELHGKKQVSKDFEAFVATLAEAERLYKSFPADGKKGEENDR